ncbi:hypothetical protein ElyMa_000398600 [Elysia marginata]|uniref:Uncharacterized protein n=1 Tax=Elysia marginata TaxID=1093978 RepID=A0AAV4FJJ1_9GAST|nr:hypothetical protein ElyMa_000398600 [Elysia marginata]
MRYEPAQEDDAHIEGNPRWLMGLQGVASIVVCLACAVCSQTRHETRQPDGVGGLARGHGVTRSHSCGYAV